MHAINTKTSTLTLSLKKQKTAAQAAASGNFNKTLAMTELACPVSLVCLCKLGGLSAKVIVPHPEKNLSLSVSAMLALTQVA